MKASVKLHSIQNQASMTFDVKMTNVELKIGSFLHTKQSYDL